MNRYFFIDLSRKASEVLSSNEPSALRPTAPSSGCLLPPVDINRRAAAGEEEYEEIGRELHKIKLPAS